MPASKTDPKTVGIGDATSTNSPPGSGSQYLKQATTPFDPIPVQAQLQAAAPKQTSQQFLRVYMTFTGAPILYEWQMLFDCLPAE